MQIREARTAINASFLNCGFEAPSKSLLPIQVSPNWFWPKVESDLDGRYRYISTRKSNIHQPTQTDRYKCEQIYRQHKCVETCRDILTGWLEVRRRPDGPWHWEVCATLCLARETGFVFFWKSDLSRWKTRFVTTGTRGLVLDDQWISGCSGEKYLCWRF